jgi:hypothetical protein
MLRCEACGSRLVALTVARATCKEPTDSSCRTAASRHEHARHDLNPAARSPAPRGPAPVCPDTEKDHSPRPSPACPTAVSARSSGHPTALLQPIAQQPIGRPLPPPRPKASLYPIAPRLRSTHFIPMRLDNRLIPSACGVYSPHRGIKRYSLGAANMTNEARTSAGCGVLVLAFGVAPTATIAIFHLANATWTNANRGKVYLIGLVAGVLVAVVLRMITSVLSLTLLYNGRFCQG